MFSFIPLEVRTMKDPDKEAAKIPDMTTTWAAAEPPGHHTGRSRLSLLRVGGCRNTSADVEHEEHTEKRAVSGLE